MFKVKKGGKEKRIPYSGAELNKMFSNLTFTEGEFMHPFEYWAPLLALLTGCRANEIAQLHVDDIREEECIFYLSIDKDALDEKIKTDVERDVQRHPIS